MSLLEKRYRIVGLGAQLALAMMTLPISRNFFLTYVNLELHNNAPLSSAQVAKIMDVDRATARDQLSKIPDAHLKSGVEGYQLSEAGLMQSWRYRSRFYRSLDPAFRPHLTRFLRKNFAGRAPLIRLAVFATELDKSVRRSGIKIAQMQVLASKAAFPRKTGHTVQDMVGLMGYSYKRTYSVLRGMHDAGLLERVENEYFLSNKGLRTSLSYAARQVQGMPRSEIAWLARYVAFSFSTPKN